MDFKQVAIWVPLDKLNGYFPYSFINGGEGITT